MPHDGATPVPTSAPNGRAKSADTPRRPKLALSGFDFTKPLVWGAAGDDWATQFHFLVTNPPLHSVVIEISSEVAEKLLALSNTRNRRKIDQYIQRISNDARDNNYDLTGDTIKFSKGGILLDGQHRLSACVRSKAPIISHVIFGLEDNIFDVLDQGKKRTAGDILGLCGISDPSIVAGAIGWVLTIQEGASLDGGGSLRNRGVLSPRKIRELALGRMKDIVDYLKDARLVNIAYKHPPTMVCGFLYLISKHDPAVARDFAHEWVHGAKIGRNKNFDVLNQRIMSIAHSNNGTVNRNVRAALLIQTFNHWHAHLVASPRALSWRRGLTFPCLEFDAERFKTRKATQDQENTSLPAVIHRVHYALTQMQNKSCETSVSSDQLAKIANVSPGSISYILSELVNGGQIRKISDGKRGSPAIYRIRVPAADLTKMDA